MKVALDEGPGPPIKYQNAELGKLHQVVSILVRHSDVSSRCQSSIPNSSPLFPNAYLEANVSADQLVPLSKEATEYLFGRTSYVKKLIEDPNVGEEGLKLLQFCSWENPHFSRSVLTELLWLCGITCLQDMRHHTGLLLHILLIEDSWQNHRIHNALMGVADERDGLLETIDKLKLHYQKRAYQMIKCLVQLFKESRMAATMLNSNRNIAALWRTTIEWLQEELDRQRGVNSQYNYSSWSPPGQSYENTNTYMLERSQSAKNTLRLAVELMPEEVSLFMIFYFKPCILFVNFFTRRNKKKLMTLMLNNWWKRQRLMQPQPQKIQHQRQLDSMGKQAMIYRRQLWKI